MSLFGPCMEEEFIQVTAGLYLGVLMHLTSVVSIGIYSGRGQAHILSCILVMVATSAKSLSL